MTDLRLNLAKYISQCAVNEGLNETGIEGVRCLKFLKPSERYKGKWPRSFVIVVQGKKEIELENMIYKYGEAHFIATPIDLPVTSRVMQASREVPFLALLINFDPIMLAEVARQISVDPNEKVEMRSHGLFAGAASEQMLEAAVRLTKLFLSPRDAKVLAPLAIKEIYYHLLNSPSGRGIYQFTQLGSKLQRIAEAIQSIRSDLTQEIDVQDMAKKANMSRTVFFKSFNEVVSMSPIQYQKRLRLIEARRLLIEEREGAESAAFKVGYKSSSQFSREYSRMFGAPPIRNTVTQS